MTKNTPRIFISLLLMLLCIGILPVSAFASSGDYPDDTLPAVESSAADTQETKQIGTVTTNGGNLNVRTGAGLDNTAFTQLPNGTVVDVIGRDGDWVKILLPARVGYVYGSYLTVTDAADSTVSIGGITLPFDEKELADLWQQGRTLTEQNLKAFEYAQKHLLGLMYERPIVPHEAPQENIQLCRDVIDCLKTGDVQTAVDEYAWTVNNVLEWYAMYFSPETIAVQDDMLWGEDNKDNLYWGTDIGFTKADVDAATRSIYDRYDEKGGDFSKEIAVYEAAVKAQTQILKDLGNEETQSMKELADLLA